MPGEVKVDPVSESIQWLEQQVRVSREDDARAMKEIDQLRRQIYELSDQLEIAERALREVEPRFVPFKGVPDKLREIEESTEHIRQEFSSTKADTESSLRMVQAEAAYDRHERADVLRRLDQISSQFQLVQADIAQVQVQTSQVNQIMMTVTERQREVEQKVEQFALRLERSIDVNRDLEQRVKEATFADLEDRFEVVFERLQVVGEMVRRSEDVVAGVAAERSMREELLHEMKMWREQASRTDGRIDILEEAAGRVTGEIEKLQGAVVLLDGRQTGLGERVQNVRKDISEVVDSVRAEFAKFNQLLEKQRRKQIQVLEQELREMKFHAFRPPEEP